MKYFKVCFVLFQTDNKANGGIASITEIISHLKCIEPIIVTQMETEMTRRLREQGSNVYIINTVSNNTPLGKVFNLLLFNLKLLVILSREKVNVIHANDIRSFIYSVISAKIKRASLVFNIRDVFEPGRHYGGKWKLVCLCDGIIVLSNSMKNRLAKRLPLEREKAKQLIKSIYSIVDFDIFCPPKEEQNEIRKSLSLPQDTFICLYAATFNDKKNQLTFIKDALPRLLKKSSDFKVCFVGDFKPEEDEYAKKCKERVKQLELEEYVHFEGYSDQIEKWYQAADITVLASRREGMARCMIESIACGTPVISFDVPTAREILEQNECGLVQKQGEYDAMVEDILYLEKQPDVRREMGSNGVKTARKLFQADNIVKQYERTYLQFV